MILQGSFDAEQNVPIIANCVAADRTFNSYTTAGGGTTHKQTAKDYPALVTDAIDIRRFTLRNISATRSHRLIRSLLRIIEKSATCPISGAGLVIMIIPHNVRVVKANRLSSWYCRTSLWAFIPAW